MTRAQRERKIKHALSVLVGILLLSNSSVANAATPYVVEKGGSGGKVLITDGYTEFIIEHDYNCYDSEFYSGVTFYIDTNYSPSYGDKIIIPGYSKSICEVTNSTQVNIRQYFVDSVFDSKDKIIVSAKNGDQFLVEYGTGCGISMWRYEGKNVDIDIGGSFLDGIGDRMYLFDSDRDCKIWDVEELGGSSGLLGTATYTSGSVPYVPPAPQNTKESCIQAHGPRSDVSGSTCVCTDNYMFNSAQQCESAGEVCLREYGAGGIPSTYSACICAFGYHLENGRHCIADPKPIKLISANAKKWSDDNYASGIPCNANNLFTAQELKECEEYSIGLYRQKYDWQVEKVTQAAQPEINPVVISANTMSKAVPALPTTVPSVVPVATKVINKENKTDTPSQSELEKLLAISTGEVSSSTTTSTPTSFGDTSSSTVSEVVKTPQKTGVFIKIWNKIKSWFN